jgi:hypothetical protein
MSHVRIKLQTQSPKQKVILLPLDTEYDLCPTGRREFPYGRHWRET